MTASEGAFSPERSDRFAARLAGVVFIAATTASIAGSVLLPDASDVDYAALLAAQAPNVAGSALLTLVAAFSSAGIAVVLYPVLRRYGPTLATASVVFRAIEAAMYILGVVILLSILSLGLDSTGDDAARLLATETLRSLRSHASLAGVFAFCLGALAYYALFLIVPLAPRWLSGAGIVAIALMLVACVLALVADREITSYVALALPIAVQEMVLAVWLIVKGFELPAPRQDASA
ncbi:MAG: DUF4386 domain-containing protein [Alphaproteobacteria bacterium]|nr:DUF4386 domain-containing protein [Alphaproteobacteria bacterium]